MSVCQGWVSAVTSSQASVVKQRTTTNRRCLWSERWATMWDSFLPTVWERWALVGLQCVSHQKLFCTEFRIASSLLFSKACLARLAQKTHAYHRLHDDVPAAVKRRRLEECIHVFRAEAAKVNAALIGSTQLVLVEGVSTARMPNTGLSID